MFLWENHTTRPTGLTMPCKQFYPLLHADSFTCFQVGNTPPPPGPGIQFITMCPIWWRFDVPERVRVEISGDVAMAHKAMQSMALSPPWEARKVALLEFVSIAEDVANGVSPCLLGALGVIKASPPLVLCWHRKEVEQSLIQALFRHYPQSE